MQRRIAQRPAESDKGVRRRKENGSARRQFLRPEALAAFDDFVEVKVVLDGDELMGKGNGMHGKLLFGKIVAMPIRGENWFLSVPSVGRATLMLKRPAWL